MAHGILWAGRLIDFVLRVPGSQGIREGALEWAGGKKGKRPRVQGND